MAKSRWDQCRGAVYHRLADADVQVEAAQHLLGAEGLVDVADANLGRLLFAGVGGDGALAGLAGGGAVVGAVVSASGGRGAAVLGGGGVAGEVEGVVVRAGVVAAADAAARRETLVGLFAEVLEKR